MNKARAHRLYGRLGDELREAALEGGPLVLLLEDLHLAGPETRELLGYAASELSGARLMIVATRRPADVGEPEAEGWPEDGAVHRLLLQPLGPELTRELVDASLGTDGLPAPLYEWIHERSEGNPARVQQLLHHLIEERVLRFRQGEWKPSLPSLARLAAPEQLQVLDRERLATLPVEELAVLEAMAVVGEPTHWRRLADLLRVEPPALYATVAGLGAKGFLEPTPEGAGVYGFAQPALGRAVYEGLPADRRRDLHRQWAELLAQRQSQGEPELVAAVAEHYWAGGDRAASLPYLLEGGGAGAHGVRLPRSRRPLRPRRRGLQRDRRRCPRHRVAAQAGRGARRRRLHLPRPLALPRADQPPRRARPPLRGPPAPGRAVAARRPALRQARRVRRAAQGRRSRARAAGGRRGAGARGRAARLAGRGAARPRPPRRRLRHGAAGAQGGDAAPPRPPARLAAQHPRPDLLPRRRMAEGALPAQARPRRRRRGRRRAPRRQAAQQPRQPLLEARRLAARAGAVRGQPRLGAAAARPLDRAHRAAQPRRAALRARRVEDRPRADHPQPRAAPPPRRPRGRDGGLASPG